MDRLIYTAMTGAKHIAVQQQATSRAQPGQRHHHRLSRRGSTRSAPCRCMGDAGRADTRAFVVDSTTGTDFRAGRDPADRARARCRGAGQGLDCGAGRGRQRGLHPQRQPARSDANGVLQTRSGLTVLGDGGPIVDSARHATSRSAKDGTISLVPDRLRSQRGRRRSAASSWSIRRKPTWCAATTACSAARAAARAGRSQRDAVIAARSKAATSMWSSDGQHDRAGAPVRHADEAAAERREQRRARPARLLIRCNA